MKLLRWAAAGASVYLIYKYSIGGKAKGENILASPPGEQNASEESEAAEEQTSPAQPRPRKARAAKPKRK